MAIPSRARVFLFAALIPFAAQAQGPKSIAVTFDDLPLNGPDIPLREMQRMTSALVKEIAANQVPAVGFVNEVQLYDELGQASARIALLQKWVDEGFELGNHTYSHPSLGETSVAAFEEEIIRGETVTRILLADAHLKLRYFRHPFLHTGKSLADRRAVESFLSARGYTVAPVTIDTLDWMFNYVYTKAQLARDSALMKRTAGQYMAFTEQRFAYYENISDRVLGRQVKHVLLLHAHPLNAHYFNRTVELIRKRGYKFITLDEALTDTAYRLADDYVVGQAPDDSWLFHWAKDPRQLPAPPEPPADVNALYKQYLAQDNAEAEKTK